MNQSYQAIIFDLDGTLLNTIPDLEAAGNHVLSTLGLPLRSTAEYQAMVGNGIPKLVERMLPDASDTSTYQSALSLYLSYYSDHSDDFTHPYEGILTLLHALQEAGYLLCVLTNKEDSLAKEVVDTFFPNLFTLVCGAKKGVASKPAPDGLFAICDTLQIAKEHVLYVGDSEVDLQTAQNAWVDCCNVLWGYRTKEQLTPLGGTTFIEEPNELLALLHTKS